MEADGGQETTPTGRRAGTLREALVQNFVESQVQYEMPVDVLTATSPISLSPFSEAAASSDNYGTHFTPYVDDGGAGAADIKAAEVEAAEATLMYRMSGTAGASQYYSHTRTNDAKSLGPHQYHHTPVNKPVRGWLGMVPEFW